MNILKDRIFFLFYFIACAPFIYHIACCEFLMLFIVYDYNYMINGGQLFIYHVYSTAYLHTHLLSYGIKQIYVSEFYLNTA
jgi:hypothetical protein